MNTRLTAAIALSALCAPNLLHAAPPSAAFPGPSASGSAAPPPPPATTPPPPATTPPPPATTPPPPASAPPPPTTAPPPTSAPPPPASAPPPPASAPPPAAAPASPKLSAAQRAALGEFAFVHLYASYPNAWLELRSLVDDGPWLKICPAPCDRQLRVAGTEARVRAPGMTTSNVFRIEPGRGTARFKVDGGSESSREIGLWTLGIGIPVSLTGMGLWGYGRLEDKKTLRTVGIATLVVGGVAILASLPMLSAGGTKVRDARGRAIARRDVFPRL